MEDYNKEMTKLFKGVSMRMLEAEDHDHKETCKDCPNVIVGQEE